MSDHNIQLLYLARDYKQPPPAAVVPNHCTGGYEALNFDYSAGPNISGTTTVPNVQLWTPVHSSQPVNTSCSIMQPLLRQNTPAVILPLYY
jgi:hypothetical protein